MFISGINSLNNSGLKTKRVLKTSDDMVYKNPICFQAAPVKPKKKFLEKLAEFIDEILPPDPPKTEAEMKKQFNDDIDDIIRLS